MNAWIDLKTASANSGATAEVNSHQNALLVKMKEGGCPVRSGGTKCK